VGALPASAVFAAELELQLATNIAKTEPMTSPDVNRPPHDNR
jgi:hypothetical protein